jgi:division protein CdvB (Snf7/Vps24/ESCRT-III family)
MYANELLEIRKLARITVQSQLALEQIVLRLETVELIGDMAITLAPATSVLKSVSDDVGWVVPEAEKEFESVGEVLDSVLVESWSRKGEFFDARAVSENARKILEDASEVAEEMIKERLPELPPALLAAREKITA